ncbi:hypothetical protein TNCV_1464381 [Trichonephila clavipes]|nr:hypothetical protein TNCV_1464381 [Trichonephila clavipes]
MATGSYLTPIYSHSQSEVLGDHHKLTEKVKEDFWGLLPYLFLEWETAFEHLVTMNAHLAFWMLRAKPF